MIKRHLFLIYSYKCIPVFAVVVPLLWSTGRVCDLWDVFASILDDITIVPTVIIKDWLSPLSKIRLTIWN